MNDAMFKLLDYGFAIFVGVALLVLAIWLIKTLIAQLKQQLNAVNVIIENHLPHIQTEVARIEDKVSVLPSLQVVCVEGFEKVSTALDKGLDRQTSLFEKILIHQGVRLLEVTPANPGPLIVEVTKKDVRS